MTITGKHDLVWESSMENFSYKKQNYVLPTIVTDIFTKNKSFFIFDKVRFLLGILCL